MEIREKGPGHTLEKLENLTQNKNEGGFGFKDFTDMNTALFTKQAWRVINNPNALWVRVLQSIYFPNESFIRARRKRQASWVWSSILHGRDEVLKSARWAVGNGRDILIQGDSWLASGQVIMQQISSEVSTLHDIIN